MAEMKTTGRRLAAHVRSLYAQQRAPVALVLVAVITVASVLSYLPLQIAAAVALLGMILQVLFDIDEKVAESKVNMEGYAKPSFFKISDLGSRRSARCCKITRGSFA